MEGRVRSVGEGSLRGQYLEEEGVKNEVNK